MKCRVVKKQMSRIFTDHERRRLYTYRGVDENGCLVVLGFTCKPKQEGCMSYGIKYIAEMLHFHGNSAYEMFSPISTRYANKYYHKEIPSCKQN